MEKPVYRESNLILIYVLTIFAVMGVASITPAFPQIIKHYGLETKQVGYLISAFTLPGIFLLPFIGIVADRFGRKTILVPSMFLFGVAGFLCAFQSSFDGLLLLRLLQGIGASALGSINITLIGDLYSGERRNEAMGYNSSILSIGTALYPAIGGLLAAADWHYVFLLPGLILPFAFLIHFKLKVPKPKEPTLFKIYLSKLWKIINQKEAWGLFLSNILVFIILYGVLLTYYPIMLSERFNAGSLAIGISMTIMSGVAALASLQFGRMRKRTKTATLLIASSLLYFCGLLILAIAHSFILIGLAITLFGIGHGLFIPNIQSLLVGMAPLSERAAFMSFNGTILRLGQSLGPVIAALFYFSQNLTMVFIAGALISILIVIVVRIFVWKAD